MTAYFYFAPGYAENSSLACNLPSSSFAEPAGTARCEVTNNVAAQSCPTACLEISEVTDQGDTLFSLMNDNIADESTARIVATKLASLVKSSRDPVEDKSVDKSFDADTSLEAGKRYSVAVDSQGAFLKATVEIEPANVFHAALQQGIIRCWKEVVVVDYKVESLEFKMKGDLKSSIAAAGENKDLAALLHNVFQWDIDFGTESMRGDTCKVLFERKYADDRPAGYGRILCAVYRGKKIGRNEEGNAGQKTAVLFNGEYFDDKGVVMKKDLLRSPLQRLRVTSKFGDRFHPIRKIWKHHDGVDYGAPEGTPVQSVAKGTVTFAGWNSGYGNLVCIKHDNGYESRYGHLQRYLVKAGQRVKQTDKLGFVGMTGIATGPHLHFELLANNRGINPQGKNVKMVKNLRTVPAPLKHRFIAVVNERLSAFGRLALAEPSPNKLFNQ